MNKKSWNFQGNFFRTFRFPFLCNMYCRIFIKKNYLCCLLFLFLFEAVFFFTIRKFETSQYWRLMYKQRHWVSDIRLVYVCSLYSPVEKRSIFYVLSVTNFLHCHPHCFRLRVPITDSCTRGTWFSDSRNIKLISKSEILHNSKTLYVMFILAHRHHE